MHTYAVIKSTDALRRVPIVKSDPEQRRDPQTGRRTNLSHISVSGGWRDGPTLAVSACGGDNKNKVANLRDDGSDLLETTSMLYNVPTYSDYSPLPSYSEVSTNIFYTVIVTYIPVVNHLMP